MTGLRFWTRSVQRLTVVGIGCGAVAVLGVGCHSVDPPIPIARPQTVQYHGLGPPTVLAEQLERPSSAVSKMTIDLGVALRLAGVDNPTVNLARERVQEALADELAAQALRLPSVTVGGNFYLHRGVLQASSGQIRDVDRQSLYVGAGARAAGTGTVTIPGVWLFAHLGDAIYEPLAAAQRVAASQSDARAVHNTILRDVASAYLRLVGAEARLDVLQRGERDLAEVVRLTRVYAKNGQGRHADADRTTANAELLRRQVREAEEDVAVASARLCRLLSLDPSNQLRTPVGSVQPFRLIAEDTDTEPLVAEAVRSRPELRARAAEIQETHTRVRQERVRPYLPFISVGYSGGGFGGGSNLADSNFGSLKGRSNFDVVAVWSIENLGFGNRARVRRANSEVGQAVADYNLVVNQIRREVAESSAEARAAARQIETTTEALAIAEEGFRLESERIRQGLGRPIETLDSFRQLLDSRQELVRAVVAFDVAQFRLFVAVGSNPLAAPGRAEVAVPGPKPSP